MHYLDRFAAGNLKCRPPDLVPFENFQQTPLENCQIQRTVSIDSDSFVVKRNVARHLGMQPYLLLGKRERSRTSHSTGTNARFRLLGFTAQMSEERALDLRESTPISRAAPISSYRFFHSCSPDMN